MANAIDPRLFAGQAITDEVQPPFGVAQQQGAVLDALDQPVPVESLLQGTSLDQQAAAIRQAGDRERAGRAAAIGAGLVDSLGGRLVERLSKPAFEPEQDFRLKEFVDNIPMHLSDDERDYLEGTRSSQEAVYKVKRIEETRAAQQAMGDHPIYAMLGNIAGDPTLLLGTALTGGVGAVAGASKLGRVAAGATQAGAAGALTAAGDAPYSDHELISNMLMNAGAGAWAYKPGVGRVRVDPDFPSKELHRLSDPFVGPVGRRMVSPERVIDEVVTEFAGKDGRKYTLELDSDYNITARFGDEIVGELESAPLGYTFGDGTPSQAAWMGVEPAHARNGVNTAMNDFAEAKVPGYSRKSNLFTEDGAAWFAGSQGKPRTRFTEQTLRRTEEAVYEDYPEPLRPGAHLTASPDSIVRAVDQVLSKAPGGVGEKLQWNIRKSMSSFGETGRKVADLLFDNNSDLSLTSMESHRWSIRQELTTLQRKYEDSLRTAMAEDGFGIINSIRSPKRAAAAQARIEAELKMELYRREQMQRLGLPVADANVSPRITAMADQLDALHAKALKELQAAGVVGAKDIIEKAGWHTRKWSSGKIDAAMEKLRGLGMADDAAKEEVQKVVALSVRRGTPGMSREVSRDIGNAIVNRALRKGYFEDALFNGGADTLAEMRAVLREEGLSGQRLERVLDTLRANTDETGKASFMKHRMDLDYKASTFVNGQRISVTDLLDTRLTHTVDQYLDAVSTQAALARKGLRTPSDIAALRAELLHSIPDEATRAKARDLFDNSMAYFNGRPAGGGMNQAMRNMSAYGRMIALRHSGLWQTTEYASMMAKYGILKTTKYALKEMPGIKTLFKEMEANPKVGRQLRDVLTEHSENNIRIRPFTNRFEDGFEYGAGDTASLLAHQGAQLVPYVNAMKFLHSHQAKLASNLIVDRLSMAANGNAKAISVLEKYGLGSQVMDKLKVQLQQHGHNIDQWDDGVWAAVRPAFGKMMDEAVLHARLGDVPAFAAFDPVGKFLFTYRGFMLSAHNKILAGGLARDGAGPTALMLAYQFPLASMAVQAQSLMQGKGVLSDKEMAAKALGQMGGLGAGAEVAGVLTGQKRGWGSPGLIPVDHAIDIVGSTARGNFSHVGGTLAQMIPIASLTPARNLGKLLED